MQPPLGGEASCSGLWDDFRPHLPFSRGQGETFCLPLSLSVIARCSGIRGSPPQREEGGKSLETKQLELRKGFKSVTLGRTFFLGNSTLKSRRGWVWGRRWRRPANHDASPTQGTARALGPASVPGSPEKVEEVPGEGSLSLQAKTRAWFQKTQAWSLLQCGGAPAWFHGFITRREAERLLEPQPRGCYLVRFSESAVTFVLTYRSQACCRHFLLGQLTDGRHVVLGEDSAHARLQDLLCHYTARPLSPYGETLSQPLARQTPEPVGLSPRTKDSDSPSQSQDPSPLHKQSLSPAWEPKEAPLPRPKPPIPAKPMLPTEVCTSPEPRLRPAPPPIYQDPEESIAFYAMGRGCPAEASSHVYAELPGLEVGDQSPGSLQLRPENSVPQQPPLCWRHTLPANLSRQVLQDRRQDCPNWLVPKSP
ncbi:SH2 domain-containing protein 2A isoform X3 [Heterocephalus glaber]|uniref:SH2 domain-containing protein 2A isoform X3 n=1 Tax=Heterocephalus glaber TaxID=10181 RepID=A0AAX6SAV4_HETGA|nr:SH2 domain-containing protein 2A isoform X3 [Heterocephalus glaber]